jgi:phosphate transport system substrate-binding protein
MKRFYISIFLSLVFYSCEYKNNELKEIEHNNLIVIKGSDTELPMVSELAQTFMSQNKEINIIITGGGSSLGIEALINNEADIANSSREINTYELEKAKKNGVSISQIMFSVDALAIITNSKLGVDSLSTENLKQIFSGEITNWKLFGGPDLPIKIYGRDTLSGTFSYIKDKFIRDSKNTHFKELKGNSEIVSCIQNDLAGIGYVGVGFLMDINGKPNGKIWAMPIYLKSSRAYSPYETEAVKNGDYVLTRPLYQYIKEKPRNQIYQFMLSELKSEGQEIIKKHGYFPINDYQSEINKLNGL